MIRFRLLLLPFLAALSACLPDRAADSPPAESPPVAVRPAPPPPAPLAARVQALGEGFDGDVGIAVHDLGEGWTAGYRADELFPQQSVSKLWVAIAVLDRLDAGELRISETVVVRREDLSVFHQPIRRFVDDDGYRTTIAELLSGAMAKSDNAANQVLMYRVGGPEAIQALLRAKGLDGIRFGPGERALQSQIAGLEWRPEYSFGWLFQEAREQLPKEWRQQAMQNYLADPIDGAKPAAVVHALARLHRGELLSREATRHLLETMEASRTGPKRLRAGVAEGWTVAHKTGTGQVLGPVATGYNDVALITAPDGRTYAVAVMIGRTTRSVPARQELMADVARAVVAHHEGKLVTPAPEGEAKTDPKAADGAPPAS